MNKGNTPPSQLGKIWVNNSSIHLLILPINLEEYIKNGYVKGKLKQRSSKRDYSKSTGSGNSQYRTSWVSHKLHIPTKIKITELTEYLNNGWVRGRKHQNKF